jgi:S-adenosylmethionine:tRNA ribosyltransferase-isomerase
MNTAELDYHLPAELVAQHPLNERDASRLLVLERTTGRISHRRFGEIATLIEPGSLVVLNDTRVMRARVVGTKPTGGRMEALLVRRLSAPGARETWTALCAGSGRQGPGTRLERSALAIEIRSRLGEGLFEVAVESTLPTVQEALEVEGRVPLPPYISRPPEPSDAARYQTVYAREPGSAAAPTAGLHFTPELLDALCAAGHETRFITLHVGPGTFRPVRTRRLEDHRMHEEWARIEAHTAEAIVRARTRGRRIVAVGTTVVRALEAACPGGSGPVAWDGPVNLFIRPGHAFRVVDDLVTNFHLPRSTLLALVMALAGREAVLEAYAQAVHNRYRFYSYGDAMLVLGRPRPGG